MSGHMSEQSDTERLTEVRESVRALAHDLRWENQGRFAEQAFRIVDSIPEGDQP